jgi:hypothetical protein
MLTDARHADVRRTPTIEVPLTVRAPRTRASARLTRAWTRVVALGFTALVGCAAFDSHGNRPIGAVLVVSTYALTIGAFGWAALETRRLERRHGLSSRRRPRT